jgi:hypothetical protein
MMKKLLILMLIITFAGAAQAVYFADDFDAVIDQTTWEFVDYKLAAQGGAYSMGVGPYGAWDGFLGADTGVQTAYNYLNAYPSGNYMGWPHGEDDWDTQGFNGVLSLTSNSTGWAWGDNTGAFLYKNVGAGDLEVTVQVTAYDFWPSNAGGLMIRKDPGDTGNEDWVMVTCFPEWGVGNHARSEDDNTNTELGTEWGDPLVDWHGYPVDPYLKIIRTGADFTFFLSPDGATWTQLVDAATKDPIVLNRPDLVGDVQVGIFQCTYSTATGTMQFDNFEIIPEPATIALLGLGGLALIRRKR